MGSQVQTLLPTFEIVLTGGKLPFLSHEDLCENGGADERY